MSCNDKDKKGLLFARLLVADEHIREAFNDATSAGCRLVQEKLVNDNFSERLAIRVLRQYQKAQRIVDKHVEALKELVDDVVITGENIC